MNVADPPPAPPARRKKDVGSTKAEVAAQFVMNRVQGVTINHTVGLIQDQPVEWYKDFQIIIFGLDNVEARRWINDLVRFPRLLFFPRIVFLVSLRCV
jgi:molybdopterin/thiamine biosynthesis adenylyltransferase